MKTLLLKNVRHEGRKTNILIEDGRFKAFDVCDGVEAADIVEADGQAILPAFYNSHTHAAMALLRGYAEDMPLQTWLQDYIWPYEDKLTAEDIAEGSHMALAEMKSSGSVCFSDMYFDIEGTIDEVDKAGMRAAIGITVMDSHSKAQEDRKWDFARHWQDPTGGRIQLTVAPHAIYTVCAEKLKRSAALARECGLKLHIHLSETRQEVLDCIRDHGTTPVRYLDSLGVLGPNVIAAHCVHVDKEEWDLLAERGVTAVHCPCSNMKIGSGRFPYELALASGARIALGTDGSSSNNNLDMREEMKFAALLAKAVSAGPDGTIDNVGDPSLLPAETILEWATRNGAEALGIDAGVIAPGKLADAVLVDLNNPKMQPCHNLISNWVYAADSSCVRTVLCNGEVILR